MNQGALDTYRKDFFARVSLEQLEREFRLKYIYNSAVLDGGTFSEADIAEVLSGVDAIKGKSMTEFLEVKGHEKAYEYMFSLVGTRRLHADLPMHFHQLLYQESDMTQASCLRTQEAMAPNSLHTVCTPPRIVIELMRLIDWVNDERDKYYPVELAAQLHKRFSFIRPFNIGNGKVARLLMNMVLLQDGFPMAIITPAQKKEYYDLLEKAHSEDKPFVDFIAQQICNAENIL